MHNLHIVTLYVLKFTNDFVLAGKEPNCLVSSRASWLEHRKALPLARSNSRRDSDDKTAKLISLFHLQNNCSFSVALVCITHCMG